MSKQNAFLLNFSTDLICHIFNQTGLHSIRHKEVASQNTNNSHQALISVTKRLRVLGGQEILTKFIKSMVLVNDCIRINLLFQNHYFFSLSSPFQRHHNRSLWNLVIHLNELRLLQQLNQKPALYFEWCLFHLVSKLLTHFLSRYNLSLEFLFLVRVFANSWNTKRTVSSSLTEIQSAVLPAALAMDWARGWESWWELLFHCLLLPAFCIRSFMIFSWCWLNGEIKYPLRFRAKLHGTDYVNGFCTLWWISKEKMEIPNLVKCRKLLSQGQP